jgi:MBG domain
MIKSLKRNDIRFTPFIANKSWNAQNQNFDNLLQWQSGSQSGSLFLTFVDYENGSGPTMVSSAIAFQQQNSDFLRFKIGKQITGSTFYPTQSVYYDKTQNPINLDGTYQSLVYNLNKNLYYKESANITQIFGLDSTDPSLTNRVLPSQIYVFNVPQNKFGEKIVPNSVSINQTLEDGNFTVIDDGYNNLILDTQFFIKNSNLPVNCVSGAIVLSNTSYTYDGNPHSASYTTFPAGLNVDLTYNGSFAPPTQRGNYLLTATINDGFYCFYTTSSFNII